MSNSSVKPTEMFRHFSLGVGPMSKNTVQACGRIANRHGIPLMLIASRRQVESKKLGGGYVENWTTREFCEYVRKECPPNSLLICRDHGGPWQHPSETELDDESAMKSSLASFEEDIRSGFQLVHIDTSLERRGVAQTKKALQRLVELYAHCHDFARALGRSVHFEIGFEDQSVDTDYPPEFSDKLHDVLKNLTDRKLPLPLFVVAQTGTKILETENVGAIKSAPLAVRHSIEQLAKSCSEQGVALKAHNADYLPTEKISMLKRCGVSSMNIAPELGVAETRALVAVLKEFNLNAQLERFLQIAFESLAWKKWMKPNSQASDADRAIIAGHYVFGTEECRAIKDAAESACCRIGKTLDRLLQSKVEESVERYVLASVGNVGAKHD
ncbi:MULTISPECIES: hypothetical protein [Rhizobium]|uniref:Tagatose-6-phosphate kinase n=2 Tax=Rhizobium TaxID=379 RepID=A0A109JWE2_9HYPH|nr:MULTISPECIES: hypothetical protein [Rhizobium]KWV56308.1 tagatose-6-phosphate kinase [Rhizobium altiplani]CCM79867.1 putative tagatose 6-phosphate kinase-like [Rhizobium mesoamericanum STM3625]